MKTFFWGGDHLKNLAKNTRRPFLTGLQFSFFDLSDCPGFLSKKYGKSNHNILKNCHYFMFCSHFLLIFLIQRLDSLCCNPWY